MKSEAPLSDPSSAGAESVHSVQSTPPVGNEPGMPHADGSLTFAPPPRKKPSLFRALAAPIVLVLLVAAGGVSLLKHDEILDWAKTRNYQPAAAVQSIVSDTGMTAYGKRLFYVNHPAIENRATFNQNCTDSSEQSVVLGCYRGNRLGIHIYNVTDERLAGIQQVTGAHEMLHQAYDRLSVKEQARIDGLLELYAKTITDQQLKDKIDLYRQTEPQDVPNEMHSVFGTEVANLPAELEDYYKQYFTDRAKVVALHGKYQAAFNERNAQIAAYDKELASLKTQIDIAKQNLDSEEAQLRTQQAQMEALLKANNVEAYNAQVGVFNAKVAAYKAEVQSINKMIQQYNQTIDARNKIAVEEQDLLRAQDSHASSVNKQ